ncbi:MAG TPA: PH domain-containing protein [Mycobacteriales bacterium]|nr:PH domain-containing protein [Mycobacteriales bacterium]
MNPNCQSLSPAVLRLWRVVSTALAGTLGLCGAVVAYATGGPAAAVAVLLVSAVLGALLWTLQGRRHRAWSYTERESDLMLRRGVLVRRTTIVPYGRMQFVDVAQGPLDRRYRIASVVLHTAAATTDAVIPGLPEDEAERLRDRLAELGKARAAGL